MHNWRKTLNTNYSGSCYMESPEINCLAFLGKLQKPPPIPTALFYSWALRLQWTHLWSLLGIELQRMLRCSPWISFCLYLLPLDQLIKNRNMCCHHYADDTQLFPCPQRSWAQLTHYLNVSRILITGFLVLFFNSSWTDILDILGKD